MFQLDLKPSLTFYFHSWCSLQPQSHQRWFFCCSGHAD